MSIKEAVNVTALIVGISLIMMMSFVFGVISEEENQEQKAEEVWRHIQNKHDDNAIKFIWNDDEESIPIEGSLVKIEMISENKVYLMPIAN